MIPAPSAHNRTVILSTLLALLLTLAACADMRGDLYPHPPAPVTRHPADLDQGPRAEVAVPRLNLRAQPSTRAEILAVLKQGTLLRVGSRENGWLRVSTAEGITGWVYASYVRLQAPAPAAATVSENRESACSPRSEARAPLDGKDTTQPSPGPTPASATDPPAPPENAGGACAADAPPAGKGGWVTFQHPAARYSVAHAAAWQALYQKTDQGDELVLTSPTGASELRVITSDRPGYRPAEFYADLVAPLSEAHGVEAEISLPTRSWENGRAWINGQVVVYASPATRHAIALTEGRTYLLATVTVIRPWVTEPEIDLLQTMRTGLVMPAPEVAASLP